MKNKLLLFGILVITVALIAGIVIYYVIDNSKNDNSKPNISIVDNSSKHDIINSSDSKKNTINSSEQKEIGTSKYYGQLDIDNQSKRLYNNLWGITDKERRYKTLKSYIYYKSDNSFGWKWDRPDPRSNGNQYITPIYPEVIVGAIPGDSDYTTHIFPIKYGDIKSWTSEVEYQWDMLQDDKNNLAYDLYWLNPDDLYDKKFNIMIWIKGHHDEKPIGEISDGINTYIHYKRNAGVGQYWEWHAFELKDQNLSQTAFKVDIKKLLDNTFPPGTLHGEWVISGMELGSEIWRGSGKIEINKYIISLNNHVIQ